MHFAIDIMLSFSLFIPLCLINNIVIMCRRHNFINI
jgi:hypothetical protein